MSVNAIIPEIWSALVKEELERNVPWLQVVEDLSGEVTPPGDRVHVNQIVTSFDDDQYGQGGATGAQPRTASGITAPLVTDYVRNEEITYGLTAATDIMLLLDQQKKWAFRVDDLDAIQTRPDLMQRNVARAMRAMGRVVNDRIRNSFYAKDASTSRAQSGATADTYENIALPDATINSLGISKTGAAVSGSVLTGVDLDNLFNVVHADYYKLAQAFIGQMMRAKEHADENYWPEEGRYCMMSPQVKNRIVEYIVNEKPNLGAGMVIDDAFINGDTPGKIFGFYGIVDPGIAPITAAAAAASNFNNMFFGLKNDGLAYAAQVQQVEGLRLQNFFADGLRGLYVFGSGWLLTDRGFRARTQIVT